MGCAPWGTTLTIAALAQQAHRLGRGPRFGPSMSSSAARGSSWRPRALGGFEGTGHVALVGDEAIRRLERRFLDTQALEDEVAWLTARLRAGQVKESNVRAAAVLGHPAAVEVTNTAPADPRLGERLARWDPRRALPLARTPDITRWLAAVREHEGITWFEELQLHAARGVAGFRGETSSASYLAGVLSGLPHDVSRSDLPPTGAAPDVCAAARELVASLRECARLIEAIKLDLRADDRSQALEHAVQLEGARRALAASFEAYVGPPERAAWEGLQASIRAAVTQWLLGLEWKPCSAERQGP